ATARRPTAAPGKVAPQLEPRQPICDVLRQPGLRILPVAGNIDPALGLHPHRFRDVTADQRALAVGEGLPVSLALEDLDDLLRPDETAHVSREEAVLATLHRSTPARDRACSSASA